MEVTEQDGGLRAGDNQDDEDEEEEAEHVIHLMGPGDKAHTISRLWPSFPAHTIPTQVHVQIFISGSKPFKTL